MGDLQIAKDGLAQRGLLVRHLVMPGGVADTRAIMKYIAEEISTNTYVNVMQQYRPEHKTDRYPEIHRCIHHAEFQEAVQVARQAGLHRLDQRSIAFG